MAGLRFNVNSGEVASTTSTLTVVQIAAPSNQRVLVWEVEVSFQGTSPTDAPVFVEILRQTSAGTMSANTPVKVNSSDDETIQTTAQNTATAEPTAGSVIDRFLVHPQTSRLWQSSPFAPLVVPGGTRLGVRVTASANVDVAVCLRCEE